MLRVNRQKRPTDEMVHPVKVLATKPADLRSNQDPQGEQADSCKLSSDVQPHKHTYKYKIDKVQ